MTYRSVWKGPKMFASQNISCLLLVVAISVKSDAYRRRKRIGNAEESDVRRGSRGSVEDFGISNRGRSSRGSVEDFGRSSVEDFGVEVFDATDFDISDRRKPRVEDSDAKESMKMGVVQNFVPPRTSSSKGSTIKSTRRRTIGSTPWSSWTFRPEPNSIFPTRPREKTKIPRSQRNMPDDLPVERIVIFPCQNEKLR